MIVCFYYNGIDEAAYLDYVLDGEEVVSLGGYGWIVESVHMF